MHYVMSDIHGQYTRYLRMLDKIGLTESDILYVLGDCIDRGPNPVDTLTDVLDRKNAVMLMGNHEEMMLKTYRDPFAKALWYRNGAATTEAQLSGFGKFKKHRLMKKVEALPLAIPDLTVNGKKFYLAHASHAAEYLTGMVGYSKADDDTRHRILWSREYISVEKGNVMSFCLSEQYKELYALYPKDTVLICGHTPVQKCAYGKTDKSGNGRISRTMGGHLINIDCGCAMGKQLGCLRLEDMQEFYC